MFFKLCVALWKEETNSVLNAVWCAASIIYSNYFSPSRIVLGLSKLLYIFLQKYISFSDSYFFHSFFMKILDEITCEMLHWLKRIYTKNVTHNSKRNYRAHFINNLLNTYLNALFCRQLMSGELYWSRLLMSLSLWIGVMPTL